ncbi:MAG: PAS domain-containing protein, partial [Chloroflexaceae bacterium]|nr:PAS domain-containing protein [Chloroflexaceae bacterium]
GDEVLYLNTLRHRSESALVLTEPLARQEALAARVLATDYRPGEVVEAIDYRGARVLGLGLPVPGVEWHLVAKIDHDEVFSQARIGVLWIALASLMTWLVAVAFAGLALQRRELHHAQRQSEAQAEKLRALQLLEAFAQSSNDLIFAQDRAGRYTLFNPAAERATGKSAAEVLGRDETAVFPLELAQPLIADNRRVLQEGCLLTREEKLPMAEGEKTYLTTKGPLRDAEGQIIGMFGICHDITARAASEAALRQSHAELERFNRAMIGRELDMIALKRRINALSIELGRAPPFDLSRIDAAQAGQEGQGP